MGTEYYLCDREKQEVLYYGKSFVLMDSWFDDPNDRMVSLTTTTLLRSTDTGCETKQMMRAALWCEGRSRVEVMADVALGACPPWKESDGGKPFPTLVTRKDWTCWTADVYPTVKHGNVWYLEDEGYKPFRLEGE